MGSWKWRLMERMYLVVMAKSLISVWERMAQIEWEVDLLRRGVQGTERPGY